jgi:hypothetical protein
MALTGGDSEKLRETLVKLQAVQTTLVSLDQIRTALQKESNLMLLINNARTKAAATAQAIYTAAVGTSTGALKAFRLALLATGIGAVIAGIGLLIANWDKLTEAIFGNTEAQKLNNQVQKQAIEAISDELSAADKLSKTLADETVSRKDKVQAVKDLQAQYPDLLSNIDAESATLDEVNRALELNTSLLKLNAQVKALQELRSEEYKKQLEAEVDAKTNSNQSFVATVLAITDESSAQKLNTIQKKQSIKESENQVSAYDELEKSLQSQIKALKEQGAVVEENSEANDDANEKAKQWAEEKRKREEEEARLAMERRKLLEDYMVESIEDEGLRSIEKMRLNHERERQALIEKYGQDTELLKALELNQAKQIEELNNQIAEAEAKKQDELNKQKQEQAKAQRDRENKDRLARLEGELIQMESDYNARIEKQKELWAEELAIQLENEELTEGEKFKIQQEYAQRIKQLNEDVANHDKQVQQDAMQTRVQAVENGLNSIQNLSDTVFSLRMSNLRKSSAEEERVARKQFKINKALQLSSAIVNGYKAITTSLADSPVAIGAVPNPAGIASLAFATTTTLANIAKIAASKYQGSPSGTGTGVSAPSIPTIGAGGEETIDGTLTAGLIGSDQQGQTNKVVIVDSEIKASLDNSAKVDTISTIG